MLIPYDERNNSSYKPPSGGSSGLVPYDQAYPPQKPEAAPVTEPTQLFTPSDQPAKKERRHPLQDIINNASMAAYDVIKNSLAEAKLKNEEANKATGQMSVADQVKYLSSSPEEQKKKEAELEAGKSKSGLTQTVKQGEALLGMANAALSPITAGFTAAEQVPIVKYPAKAANWTFGALGKIGSFGVDKVLDILPLPDPVKAEVRPLGEELGAFVAQIAGIHYGIKGVAEGKSYLESKRKLTPEQERQITELYGVAGAKMSEAVHQSIADGVPVTPDMFKQMIEEVKKELPVEAKKIKENKDYVYEPYTPDAQLPVIDMGTIPKVKDTSGLPTIQIGEPKPKEVKVPGDFTYEPTPDYMKQMMEVAQSTPLHETIGEVIPRKEMPIAEPKLPTPQEIMDSVKTKPEAKPKTEKKVTTTQESPKPVTQAEAEQLKSRAYERLQKENPSLEGDLQYSKVNQEKDIANAVDIMTKDKQRGFDIAMGKESTSEVTSTAMNIVMAEQALKEGNYDMYVRLTRNRSLEQTRRGQEISAEKASVNDNSTASYVKELLASKLEALGNNYLADLKETIKKGSKKQKGQSVIDAEVAKVEEKIKTKKLDMESALKLLDKLTCLK